MAFLQNMLVALDGSAVAERALDFAIELTHQYRGELLLCTSLDYASSINAGATPETAYQSVPAVFAEYESAARSSLQAALSRARSAGARASTLLAEGRPVPAILAAARERNVDAIVLGTMGKRDIELLVRGSTADGVLRLADVPTFVVNQFGRAAGKAASNVAHGQIRRILVAFDDSDPAVGALRFAVSLATAAESVVICCSAVPTGQLTDNAAIYGCDAAPYVAEARQAALSRLEAETISPATPPRHIERIILEGYAPDAVLTAAVEYNADVIVCGSHGRRGIRHLMLGSVAESLVRRSNIPVAVVRRISNERN